MVVGENKNSLHCIGIKNFNEKEKYASVYNPSNHFCRYFLPYKIGTKTIKI